MKTRDNAAALGLIVLVGCATARPYGSAEVVEVQVHKSAVIIAHVGDGIWDQKLHDRTCPKVDPKPPPVDPATCKRALNGECLKWELVKWRIIDTGGVTYSSARSSGTGGWDDFFNTYWSSTSTSGASRYVPNKEIELTFECR